MTGFDASQALRYSMDYGGLAIPSILGVSQYASILCLIQNDQIDINDTDTARIVSRTRLTVADGYRSYAPGDGYLNPCLSQTSGESLIISAGYLTTNSLILGPLCFPYTVNGVSGGIDPAVFQPAIGSNNNLSVYVQIQGVSLSPRGNYFTVEDIEIDNMSTLSYSVKLKSNLLTV